MPVFAGHHEESGKKDIVGVAAENDNFSTLVKAVKAAGLVSVLKQDGPYTVFAPTNEAFNTLPDGTLEMLLKPENKDELKKVLTYHVLAQKVSAKQAMKTDTARTVEGSEITLMTSMGKVMVNNANVIKADVMASNGVIHVIDKVLLPPQLMSSL
nr:fasciclin domain-containing protein [Alteromonas halophila]